MLLVRFFPGDRHQEEEEEEEATAGLRFGDLLVIAAEPSARRRRGGVGFVTVSSALSSTTPHHHHHHHRRHRLTFAPLEPNEEEEDHQDDSVLLTARYAGDDQQEDYALLPAASALWLSHNADDDTAHLVVFVDAGASGRVQCNVVCVEAEHGRCWISSLTRAPPPLQLGRPVFTQAGELVGVVARTNALLGLYAVVDLHFHTASATSAPTRRGRERNELRAALHQFRVLQHRQNRQAEEDRHAWMRASLMHAFVGADDYDRV